MGDFKSAFVSLEARKGLIAMAEAAGYTRGGIAPIGLRGYIEAVLQAPGQRWRDERPDWMKEHDLDLLLAGKSPMWNMQFQKTRWTVYKYPLAELTAVAYEYGVLGRGIRMPPMADASAVLEAWGLKLLVPTIVPPNQHPFRTVYKARRRAPRSTVELDW